MRNMILRLLKAALFACCALCASPLWAQARPALELLVLGSGGPGAFGRAASSYLVLLHGVPRILVDAGPGSFTRLGEAAVSLRQTDLVLLTHLHVDHVGELPGLIKARAVSAGRPISMNVFGPAGRQGKNRDATFPATSRLMQLLFGKQGAFGYLMDFSAPIKIKATDVDSRNQGNPKPKLIWQEGDLTIYAITGHHRDAPAVIYRINYADQSITFSGDIDPAGWPGLRRIAQGTDLLVFNSVVLDPPGSPSVLYTLHTPPKAIGEIARDSGAKTLLLSHISPAVEDAQDEVKGSISSAFGGKVTFAKDGDRLRP